MNFITFSVGTTNVFPMANSTAGGQYATEFNLRSRESVATAETVKYLIGPSYVHSESDYYVSIASDSAGIQISSSKLVIGPGRGVFNGHFVENLVPMEIDIADARSKDQSLVGDLCIGIRVMYSTVPTMAGSIRAENSDNMYEGIQVVVLPKERFKLPVDVPNDENAVTAHLKLAEFTYRNGRISGLVNNYPEKCYSLSATRIGDIDQALSGTYLSKAGLNERNLYVFAGKGIQEGSDGSLQDTWCKAQDSLMIWDRNPTLTDVEPSVKAEASFVISPDDDSIQLRLPHKQIDYDIKDTHGKKLFYADKSIQLPKADYASSTPGTVTSTYTNSLKHKFEELRIRQTMPTGSQLTYIDELHDRGELPRIESWSNSQAGDYILVGHDYTVLDDSNQYQVPTTIYVVLPGVVQSIKLSHKPILPGGDRGSANPTPPEGGVELDYTEYTSSNTTPQELNANLENSDYVKTLWDLSDYRGRPNVDYFTVHYNDLAELKGGYYWFFTVEVAGGLAYSDPLWVTGEMPFATEETIGGFLNVPENTLDGGYVYLDSTGHLRLLDYALLRTGTLAYQLCDDITISGLTGDAVQEELNDKVNDRVAFLSVSQQATRLLSGAEPNVVHVTLDLTEESTETTVAIRGIDSRFNCAVYLHIRGTANDNTHIIISDCQRLRIDSNIGGSPVIDLYRSCLYYDSTVLDKLFEIYDLSLWYEQSASSIDSDDDDEVTYSPNLIVNGLTVQELNPQIVPEDLDFWNELNPNDNHYQYALKSITFDSRGNIIGCSLLVRNDSTLNVDPGKSIYVSDFRLPQGNELSYPKSRLRKQIKVTGSFVSAYYSNSDRKYILTDTKFTALSQTYSKDVFGEISESLGTISFYAETELVNSITGVVNGDPFVNGTPIDGWAPNSFHIFQGGTIS